MALTWREISAPDLSGSLRGYEQFNNTLQSALGGLRDTVGGIDRGITDRASQALMLQALQAQDPDTVRALTTGVDPRRVNAAAIAMLGQRPGQILQEQNQELALKGARRTDSQTEAFDALQSDLAAAEAIRRAGGTVDPALQARINSAPIGARNAMAARAGLDASEMFGVDLTGKRQDQSIRKDENTRAWNRDARDAAQEGRAATEFSWKATDRTVEKAAEMLAPEIFDRGLDPEGIRGLIMQQPPQVRGALLRQAASFGYGNVFQPQDLGLTPSGSAAGMSPGTNTNPWDTVVGNGAYGTPPKPLSSMTMGEVIDFGKNTLIPATKAAGVGRDSRGLLGSSAAGTFQITQSTLSSYAPKVLGSNWRSQGFTPENQEKIAKAIFDDNKGSAQALKGQWASLSLADAERVRKMPWDQAKRVIAAGETSASPAAFERSDGLTARATTTGSQIRNTQDQNDPVFQIYSRGLDKAGISTEEVARAYSSNQLKDLPVAYVRDRVQEIIHKSNGRLNPTQAADLLTKNIVTDSSYWNRLTGRGSFWGDTFGGRTNLAGGRQLNQEGLDADIAKVLTGNPTDRVQSIEVRKALTEQLVAAQTRAKQATAAMKRVLDAQQNGRNIDPNTVRRYTQQAQQTNQAAIVIRDRLANADSQPERTSQQQLPPSASNPRNRWTGAPVAPGSLIGQIWDRITGN